MTLRACPDLKGQPCPIGTYGIYIEGADSRLFAISARVIPGESGIGVGHVRQHGGLSVRFKDVAPGPEDPAVIARNVVICTILNSTRMHRPLLGSLGKPGNVAIFGTAGACILAANLILLGTTGINGIAPFPLCLGEPAFCKYVVPLIDLLVQAVAFSALALVMLILKFAIATKMLGSKATPRFVRQWPIRNRVPGLTARLPSLSRPLAVVSNVIRASFREADQQGVGDFLSRSTIEWTFHTEFTPVTVSGVNQDYVSISGPSATFAMVLAGLAAVSKKLQRELGITPDWAGELAAFAPKCASSAALVGTGRLLSVGQLPEKIKLVRAGLSATALDNVVIAQSNRTSMVKSWLDQSGGELLVPAKLHAHGNFALVPESGSAPVILFPCDIDEFLQPMRPKRSSLWAVTRCLTVLLALILLIGIWHRPPQPTIEREISNTASVYIDSTARDAITSDVWLLSMKVGDRARVRLRHAGEIHPLTRSIARVRIDATEPVLLMDSQLFAGVSLSSQNGSIQQYGQSLSLERRTIEFDMRHEAIFHINRLDGSDVSIYINITDRYDRRSTSKLIARAVIS